MELQKIIESISGFAEGAKKSDEPREAGPGEVTGTVETKNQSELVTLEMTEEECAQWWARVDAAETRLKAQETQWDILLNEYLPIVSKSGAPETVKVNAHFRNLHSKIGQLFYRSPDVTLTPDDPSPAQNQMPNPMQAMMPPGTPPLPPLTMEDIIAVKQAVLKKKLGRDGIKANRLMDELLFDVLAWSGIGVCKVGYQCYFKDVQMPVMGPDPNFQPLPPAPGTMLGLQPPQPPPEVPQIDPATGQPQMKTEKVPVHEEWYARRFSPKKFLTNVELKSCRHDEDATWEGMFFFITKKTAMDKYKLTESEANAAVSDDRVHEYPEEEGLQKTKGTLIRCVEVYCKASLFTDEVHPLALNQLVLIGGLRTRPAVWRPSPDQEFDEMGKLTKDSVVGFPYRVLTIRDLADSCFPKADAAYTNSGIKQLSTWRRQSIRLRDAAIGKYLYDSGAFDTEEIEQLKNGEIGEFIPVADGRLKDGVDKIFAATTRIQSSQDDQRGQSLIKQDNDETLGIGANQSGVETDTVRTATEVATISSAMQARNDKELGRVVDFYLDLVRMVDQLLMRYADQDEYILVAGDEGAGRIAMWNGKMVSGKYLYDIAPDSQLRVDTGKDFQSLLNFYNIIAGDPLANRAYVLKRLARMKGLDPSKVIIDPALMAAQPQHGGPGQKVSDHAASNSGGRPNEPGAGNHRAEEVK